MNASLARTQFAPRLGKALATSGLILAIVLGAGGCDSGEEQGEQADYAPITGKLVFSFSDLGEFSRLIVLDGPGVTEHRAPGVDLVQPAWSPDGSKIAYVGRGRTGGQFIQVMNADGTERKTLVGGLYEHPDWAPEGDRIVYVDLGGRFYIHPLGGEPQEVVIEGLASGHAQHPVWSPGGDKIAFSLRGDIYVVNPDGRELQRLTSHPDPEEYPAWSPDGAQIVFSRKLSPSSDLYVMNADGTGQTLLVEVGRWPTWSSQRGEIAFDKFGAGLHVIRSDGTDMRQISRKGGLGATIFDPDWL